MLNMWKQRTYHTPLVLHVVFIYVPLSDGSENYEYGTSIIHAHT